MYFPTNESVMVGRCGPCCSTDPATSSTVVFPDLMVSRISVQLISSIRTVGCLAGIALANAGIALKKIAARTIFDQRIPIEILQAGSGLRAPSQLRLHPVYAIRTTVHRS